MAKRRFKAFTLAEIVIALSVLALISSVTLAKLILPYQSTINKSVSKDIVSIIGNILDEARFNNVQTSGSFRTLFFQRVQALKYCNSAVADGCYAATWDPTWNNRPAVLLDNGAQIWLGITNANFVEFQIQLNVANGGPNFWFVVNVTRIPRTHAWSGILCQPYKMVVPSASLDCFIALDAH
jgi:type II secretory pathway pseudopilin PulG